MTTSGTPVQAAPIGRPGYSRTFPCNPETAVIGRKLVREALSAWHLDDLTEPAELIISELVANASRHTPCHSIRLIVQRPDMARVRIGVVDRAPSRLPVLNPADATDESGRGLLLIDALSDCWGYTLLGSHPARGPWGKETWAELKPAAL
ncbi:ATP-binding protein [Streptomyces sp. NPDC048297]|uniref:ATP-binding protein n=1 Tax=Streptomyces sp. NPDC048297 TaxID=3365531 RepID=UPI00371480B8